MSIATALHSGDEALPQLAEAAVREAMDKAGLCSASSVLLFLTPDFARHAQQAVTAAARAASSLQVGGGIAAGVFTEDGWVLDRPAAAAMVFGKGIALGVAEDADAAATAPAPERKLLSYAASALVPDWKGGPARFGGSFSGAGGGSEPVVWQGSRIAAARRCGLAFSGARIDLGVSSGLRLLAPAQRVDAVCAYDVEEIGRRSALLSLLRVLPEAWQAAWHVASPEHAPLPLHHLCAILIDDQADGDTQAALAEGRFRPVPIIAVNADDSLTLGERVLPGQRLAWAVREAGTCIDDMQRMLARLAAAASEPLAALAFSCIGRGPYFYGGDDEDRALLLSRFPGLPLLGVYGTGQLAPGCDGDNRALHNSVVAALISHRKGLSDVQSDA